MRMTAVLLVLTSGAAFAAPDCKPVVGHFEAQVVPVGQRHCTEVSAETLCTAGRVWGGIQGNYEFVATGALPSETMGGVPGILFFTGKSTVFLKSGDTIVGTDTGSIDVVRGGFASLITFPNGQIRLRGELVDGTTSGDYIGSLCQ